MQHTSQGTYIMLPKLENTTVCPFRAFSQLVQQFPASPNSPFFSSASQMLTESKVRAHLRYVLKLVDYGYHTFRRTRATLAYNLNVPMQYIKRHGTLKSDAVYQYIITDPAQAVGVAKAFQHSIR